MDTRDLGSLNIIVTGASRGIGQATAILFAKKGANLILGARSKDKLRSLVSMLESYGDGIVSANPVDVTNKEEVNQFVELAAETMSGIDILVHSAGVERANGSRIEDVSPADFHVMSETNIFGTYYLTHETMPHLRESKGNLVLLGSFAGQYPRPDSPIYAATKWWLRGFARSLQAEVGRDNVSVSVINPSEVRTGWQGSDQNQPICEAFSSSEASDPEEVAEIIEFVVTRKIPNTILELDFYRRDKLANF